MSQSPADSNPSTADDDPTDTSNLKDGNLKIDDGATAATVLVRRFITTSGEVGGFGFTDSGSFYSGGLSWKYKNDQPALALTFVLKKDVASLSSSTIQFSAVVNKQQTASMAAASVDDSFLVSFSSGALHDPQIVVTPIGN